MNEKIVVDQAVDDEVEVIDLGDATVETRQPHDIHDVADSCCTFTYWGK